MVFSSQAYVLVFIGLMISLGGALFAYLISTLGGFPQLKGWAQKEFKELIYSVLIVFLGMFLLHYVVLLVCYALIGYSGPLDINDPVYFTQGKVFLKVLDLNLQNIAERGVRTSAILSGYSKYGITFGVPIPMGGLVGFVVSVSMQPLAGLNIVADMIGDITKTVIMTNFLVSVMDSILDFIKITSFTIFFPLGIILRALPITRRLGSTLIALAITFYFIFPMTILFNQYIYVNMFLGGLSYDNEDPISVALLEERLEQKLEDETKMQEKMDEHYPEGGDILIDEFGSLTDNINDINEETNWNSNLGDKIKNFFAYIGRSVIRAGEVISNTINNLLFGTLSKLSKLTTALAGAALGINLSEFAAEPIHYTAALANQVLQKFIFIAICFFMDVIICLTLFANISGILGGETKIFGIEKLKLG
ncbi:hypothetical protein KO317_02110 [Candidatus Micrarchaeota archaeon]|nr:hypothetical protein [Candidatus Micrarchaeota archaeon]